MPRICVESGVDGSGHQNRGHAWQVRNLASLCQLQPVVPTLQFWYGLSRSPSSLSSLLLSCIERWGGDSHRSIPAANAYSGSGSSASWAGWYPAYALYE
eukprot:3478787-Rhodomonas_salina.1